MDILFIILWTVFMIIMPILFFVALLFVMSRVMSGPIIGDARGLEEEIKRTTDREKLRGVTSFIGTAFFQEVSNRPQRRLSAVSIVLTTDGITIYDETVRRKLLLSAPYSALRGVFLSEGIYNKYHYSLEFHFYHDGLWQFLYLPMEILQKRDYSYLLYELNHLSVAPRHGGYRNRRFAPSEVREGYFATRKLTGAWLYKEAILLCLTPIYLVITTKNGNLQHTLPLENIKEIKLFPNPENVLDSVMQLTMLDDTGYTIGVQGTTFISKIAKVTAESQGVSVDTILQPADTRKKLEIGDEKIKWNKEASS